MPNHSDDLSVKDAFHMAKLALFNVRLLHDIESARARSSEISDLVAMRASADRITPPISVMSQATFLQFAYVCLVWLWELAKADGSEDEIVDLVQERFVFDQAIRLAAGERSVTKPKDVLRIVRNAISHARVVPEDGAFRFSDIDKKKEKSETAIRLSWVELGQLSEAVLFSMDDKIYSNPVQSNA